MGQAALALLRPGTLLLGPFGLRAGLALASLWPALWLSHSRASPSSWPKLDSDSWNLEWTA